MKRIIFMGTPEFAVPSLQALIDTQQVVGVVTQPDRPAGRGRKLRPSPVKLLAEANHLPVYQPKSLRKEETAVPLREWRPDAIVVAAFGQILRPHVLDLPPLGCINVHGSLLPRWRGASPIQHALLAGDTQTGITLMKMDVGLDTGPMYVKEAIPIAANETAVSLHDKLADLGANMLRNYLDDILNGRIVSEAQDDTLSTYAPMIKKEDGQLDWSKSGRDLDLHIRAMTPWPGAFTFWEGEPFKVREAQPVEGFKKDSQPGVVQVAGETAVVTTGDGGLSLTVVQPAGKRAMPIADFLRGHPQFDGIRLGT